MKTTTKISSTVLFLLFVSLSSLGAQTPVAQLEYFPGYEMEPRHYLLTITDEGLVNIDMKAYNTGETTRTELGSLNEAKLETLIAIINEFKDLKLIDPEAGQPQCTDTPSLDWSVFNKKGEKIDIQSEYGCHKAQVNNWKASAIVKILDGWFATARL